MNEQVQTASTEPLFNPLAPEFIRNPYPYYERLRTTDPMHLTPLGSFVASRHAEASLVLRDRRFGKDYVKRTTCGAGRHKKIDIAADSHCRVAVKFQSQRDPLEGHRRYSGFS